MMTRTTRTHATGRALGLAAISALVLAVACQTPAPTSQTGSAAVEQRPLELEATQTAAEDFDCTPAVYLNGSRYTEPLGTLHTHDIRLVTVHGVPNSAISAMDGGDAPDCRVIVVETKSAAEAEAEATRRLLERLRAER